MPPDQSDPRGAAASSSPGAAASILVGNTRRNTASPMQPPGGAANSDVTDTPEKNTPASNHGGGSAAVVLAPRTGAARSSSPHLQTHSPPALARQSGGDHSPAHLSNSTSPFYMADITTAAAAGAGARSRNGEDNSSTNKKNGEDGTTGTSAARLLTPLRTTVKNTAVPRTSPREDSLYPTIPDAGDAELIAFEEQEPRGSAWGIPSVVVLRHRMGFSTVELTAHQRETYSRYDLENFVLYKEQKYNAVNVLWRFCLLLMFILTFSVFCLVFSTCTTEWVALQHTDSYLSLGLFVACHNRSWSECAPRVSSRLEWTVTDVVTGATLCTASANFVHRFIGAIWSMAILQLLCELIALALTAWIAARPTRSGALVMLFFDLLLGTLSGVVAVVLFHHYSSCLRQTCEGEHLSGRLCNVSWRYGYKLYLGALAVHGLLLLLALCMHSYIHNIRVTARKQLRAERHRASRRHADAVEYMVHVMNSTTGGTDDHHHRHRHEEEEGEDGSGGVGGYGRDNEAALGEASPNERRRLATTQRGTRSGEGGSPPPPRDAPEQPGHSTLHISFADVPDRERRRSPSAREQRNARGGGDTQQGQQSWRGEQGTHNHLSSSGRGDGGAARSVSDLTERTAADSGLGSEVSPPTAFATQRRRGDRRRQRQRTASPLFPTGSPHQPQHHHVTPGASNQSKRKMKKKLSSETAAYTQARKRNRFFMRFFQRAYDANYLTAAELGVPIAGATDWVYDDRSDMYYSFERNMFWDPLTHEYYNCALKTWQESPDQVVEVRDVLDFMLEESEEGSGGEDGQAEQAEQRSAMDVDVYVDASEEDEPTRRRRSVQHHGEPITAATATATGGAESSAIGGTGPSASSRNLNRSAWTAEGEEGDERVFRAGAGEDASDLPSTPSSLRG
ncbi:hypothetical protein ABB37_02290 [Leptomonas pyrrhocoris]|uniref:Transmembrane protein n=1 Tax=Leptomonas pyrrhocoris TaxID=157538 RepID=A0A0M9G7H5_LEPPY|nr:hypothetical protein ABB37_02290 [Leptomonas pyrrhocoris]KPA84250.1 hypothetical protein ABB37_02290 [Leptomonas pyrrhocoris]|eukprot:XP_015662689.1 hypothetical protein ABB37_02290 [Leptomonas pyrrhocoris]